MPNAPAPDEPIDEDAALRLAIDAAHRAAARGDGPFGAALVSPAGQVLGTAMNQRRTADDSTGHAEMVLVREAQAARGAASLRGATVYASGEPCAMCAGAMFWAGVGRIVYGATAADVAEILGEPMLPIPSRDVLADARPIVRVDGPRLRDEARAALQAGAPAA